MTGNSLTISSGRDNVNTLIAIGIPQVIKNNCQCLSFNKNRIFQARFAMDDFLIVVLPQYIKYLGWYGRLYNPLLGAIPRIIPEQYTIENINNPGLGAES